MVTKKKKKKKKKKPTPSNEPPEGWSDPWSLFKSIYGGKLSPKEEYDKILGGALREGYCIEMTPDSLVAWQEKLSAETQKSKKSKKRKKKVTAKVLPVEGNADSLEKEKCRVVIGASAIPADRLISEAAAQAAYGCLILKRCNLGTVSVLLSQRNYAPPSLIGLNIAQNALDDASVVLGNTFLRSLNASIIISHLVIHLLRRSWPGAQTSRLNLSGNLSYLYLV